MANDTLNQLSASQQANLATIPKAQQQQILGSEKAMAAITGPEQVNPDAAFPMVEKPVAAATQQEVTPTPKPTEKPAEAKPEAPAAPSEPGEEPEDDGMEQFNVFMDNQVAEAQNDVSAINDKYEKVKAGLDEATAELVTGLQQSYGARLAQMERANAAAQGALTKAGIRAGRQRFASEIQTSIISAEERAGIERLAAVEGEMHMQIGMAQMAAKEKDWEMFNDKMGTVQSLRAEQRDIVLSQREAAQKQEALLQRQLEFQAEERRENIRFERDELEFFQEQEDRMVSTFAPSYVFLDESGEVQVDVSGLEGDAEQIGISPQRLLNQVSTEVERLQKLNRDQRKAQLDLLNSESLLNIREAQELRDAQIHPLLVQKKIQDIRKFDLDQLEQQQELTAEEKKKFESDTLTQIELADKLNLIEDILSSEGLKGAVGEYKFKRVTPLKADKAERLKFSANVKRLISQETLSTLTELKAKGGTLGALSDQERLMLQNAASNLGSWMQLDKNGNPTGKFEVSETDFKEEVDRIKDLATSAFVRAGGDPSVLKSLEKYGSFDSFVDKSTPEQRKRLKELKLQFPEDTDQDLLDVLKFEFEGVDPDSFKSESQTSEKGNILGLGEITGFGSPLWKHGLDVDLKIGDPVPSPVSGKVKFVGSQGGFGKQVKIQGDDGREYWLSHLDSFDVKVGQKIRRGEMVAKGGNTGKTIPGPNGDGSHLDLTVKNPDGSFMDPKQIFRELKTA